MSRFKLLRDPDAYSPQDQDLVKDETARTYWLDLFASQFRKTLNHAAEHYGRAAAKSIDAAAAQFAQTIERLRAEPDSLPGGALNTLALNRLRAQCLREHGLPDPFGHVKERENARAAELYADVVRRLHVLPPEAMWLRLVSCVFAGNAFDLGGGAERSAGAQEEAFLEAAESVHPRPWVVDDFDALLEGLTSGPPAKWSKAVFMADNAGSDFTLGVMPLVRELALAGTQVVLAANESPSLNDITADEAVEVVEHLAADDADLAAVITGNMLEVVSTGGDIALLDLSDVSDELNEVAADADLVVLEGMGRAVESNYDAAFTVDALRLALLKDARVAAAVGGEVNDCICKLTPADG
jgi:uncharacterized protein with ATP-grasp and redox domains